MSLNIFHVLAIICLALSALFGYLGSTYESRRSKDEQLEKISKRFDELGANISRLQADSSNLQEVDNITDQYKDLAQEYLSVLPQKAQQLRVDAEKQRLDEIQKSREIQSLTDFVSKTLAGLVAEFRRQGIPIGFETMAFPSNMFSLEPYRLRLFVNDSDFWSIHFVDRQIGKIGLMFVRVLKDKSGREFLTNDSVLFRWVATDRYGFSLNDRISPEARTNLMERLGTDVRPLSSAQSDLKQFVVNLVKYELARSKVSAKAKDP